MCLGMRLVLTEEGGTGRGWEGLGIGWCDKSMVAFMLCQRKALSALYAWNMGLENAPSP